MPTLRQANAIGNGVLEGEVCVGVGNGRYANRTYRVTTFCPSRVANQNRRAQKFTRVDSNCCIFTIDLQRGRFYNRCKRFNQAQTHAQTDGHTQRGLTAFQIYAKK